MKKVGEETAEVIIGAKNPGKDEVVYEISDLLYHLTVLMVEKGVVWEGFIPGVGEPDIRSKRTNIAEGWQHSRV